jgi:hypothetical protein
MTRESGSAHQLIGDNWKRVIVFVYYLPSFAQELPEFLATPAGALVDVTKPVFDFLDGMAAPRARGSFIRNRGVPALRAVD